MTDLPLVRNSERSDFKSCPSKWNWRWNLGLVPAMSKQDARWFGTQWHLLWATVYTPPGKDGFVRALTIPSEIHDLWDSLTAGTYVSVSGDPFFDDDKEKEWNDACALGHIMIDGQLKEWNLDPAFEVLMPEQRFRMRIPYNERQLAANMGLPFEACGILLGTYDMPIRDHTDSGKPKAKVLDWKTTAARTNNKQLNKDDQTGTYLASATASLRAIGLIKPDEAVDYMIFSFARKAKPPADRTVDERGRVRNKPQKNHYQLALGLSDRDIKGLTIAKLEEIASKANVVVYGEVSKNQGSPLFWRDVVRRNRANRLNQISRIADELELMYKARNGDIPIVKSPGPHCNWCDYSDLCDIDEDGGDVEGYINDVFKYDDPYGDHREGAVNSKESRLK